MELKVRKIQKDAKIPRYGHKGDAGLDIFSVIDHELKPKEVKAIPSGIQV